MENSPLMHEFIRILWKTQQLLTVDTRRALFDDEKKDSWFVIGKREEWKVI